MDFCECGHLISEHFELDGQGVPFQVMCQGWIMSYEVVGRCCCVNFRRVK